LYFGLEDGGSEDVGYGYVIRIILYFTLPLVLTFVNILLVLVIGANTISDLIKMAKLMNLRISC
jgi:hypothetical protein